ncbi:MAG: sucrase ferredoxin [Candidatus Nanopelagicales bacterium]
MTERCSVVSADEPLAGTAPRARAWLVLEQPGPYGFRALTESHLPERVRAALGAVPKESRTTVLLARPVGRHADPGDHDGTRRFWFAHVAPGGVRMRSGVLPDTELLRPDLVEVLDAAARGELPPWGTPSLEPLLLVCTNSKRDVCCALNGRPVAQALASDPAYAGSVLEVSHVGGHRFSPTGLLLPWGVAFGRLDAQSAREVLDAAREGRVGALDRVRGRTAASQPVQAAAVAVRRAEGIDGIDDIDALRVVGERAVPAGLRWQGDDGVADIEVRHVDGRAWRVLVRQRVLEPPRPESCGKSPIEPHVWVADPPVATAPWNTSAGA